MAEGEAGGVVGCHVARQSSAPAAVGEVGGDTGGDGEELLAFR